MRKLRLIAAGAVADGNGQIVSTETVAILENRL